MAQEDISARASLAVIGPRFEQMGIWTMVEGSVQIKQKVLRHTPLEKLKDCLINMLAGGTGVVETNFRVRPDRAVQLPFGRQICAKQSAISDTLNVSPWRHGATCSAENMSQMRSAINEILRHYGGSYLHPYETQWQLLDVDGTGDACRSALN